jgi:Tfp pilus assembly protein PilO
MSNPSNRRHSWFITLSVSLAALGFLCFAFIPTARAIRNARNEIREQENFIAQTDSLHHCIVQSEHELNEVHQFTNEWRHQTPTPGQLANLFGKITDRVHQSGAISARFEPQQEVPLETIRRVPVRMELTGSYTEICRLLAALERLPENVWVEELKIEKQREAGKDVQCELKLEVFAVDSKESG